MSELVRWIIDSFSSLPKELAVFLIAMLPVFELRLAIPLAITIYGMRGVEALLWAFLGNLIIVLPVLFLYEVIADFLSKHSKLAARFFNWIFERTRHKHNKRFEQYGALALVLFVAVPLPGTGGWTGSIAAFVFGINKLKAFLLIGLGILLAALIVTAVSLSGIKIFV